MSVTFDSVSAPSVRCGQIINQVLTVATLIVRNATDATVEPMVGSGTVCVWWKSAGSDVYCVNLIG
jgi:hypothetical protein